MQSRNIFWYHSIVCTVPGELMRTVLPSLSTSMPPNDHSTGPAVEIEARLRRHLGGELRLLRAHVRDVIDLQLDARVFREALADLRELLVGGAPELVPAEVADLTHLGDGRRRACGEDADETGPAPD